MDTFVQDLRFGLRMLVKSPGFSSVVIITLALGIGATSVIFSIVNAVLLRPLPYRAPDRLVTVWQSLPKEQVDQVPASAPNFLEWQAQSRTMALTAFNRSAFSLTGADRPERLDGGLLRANAFEVLGVLPILGRTFRPGEDQLGADPVVVLSYGLWQRRFGGDPGVLKRTILLNSKSYRIVGVMPPKFQFMGADVWVPLAFTQENLRDRGGSFLRVMGRLKPGITIEQARADTTAIANHQAELYPDSNFGWSVSLVLLNEQVLGNIRRTLLVLFGAVAFVLLVAATNVASLLLARATDRVREMAVRAALGAARGRLIRQALTESLLLALLGGAGGLLLAFWGTVAVVEMHPNQIPRVTETGIDGRVLAFTLGISVLCGILFGLVPALQATRPRLGVSLKESGVQVSASRFRFALRSALVVGEVALALVLLLGAGLMVRSFRRLQQVDPGFHPEHVLVAQVTLQPAKYPQTFQKVAFFQQVVDSIRQTPGVVMAGAVTTLPLTPMEIQEAFMIEGRPPTGGPAGVGLDLVTPDYFRAMGIPLLGGRGFTPFDRANAPKVAIIDEGLKRQFFPAENPLGKRILIPGVSKEWREIVGVVGGVRHYGLDSAIRPQLYVPLAEYSENFMTLVVRGSRDPLQLASVVRAAVWRVDKDQPIAKAQRLEQLLADSISQQRFNSDLMQLFALLALVLAAVGIHGVIAFSVTQRTHEIGVRMALGSEKGRVLRLILGHGMRLVLAGLVLGWIGALALTRVLSSMLFGIEATDPMVFAVVPPLLVLVAFAAAYLPARRATRVDPAVALRYE